MLRQHLWQHLVKHILVVILCRVNSLIHVHSRNVLEMFVCWRVYLRFVCLSVHGTHLHRIYRAYPVCMFLYVDLCLCNATIILYGTLYKTNFYIFLRKTYSMFYTYFVHICGSRTNNVLSYFHIMSIYIWYVSVESVTLIGVCIKPYQSKNFIFFLLWVRMITIWCNKTKTVP